MLSTFVNGDIGHLNSEFGSTKSAIDFGNFSVDQNICYTHLKHDNKEGKNTEKGWNARKYIFHAVDSL